MERLALVRAHAPGWGRLLSDRIQPLDGLRGLAAFAVLLFHAKVPGVRGGFLGVDVFFVLSGFVITRLLIREFNETGGVQLLPFYVRRFARLMPAYALFLCTYAVVAPMTVLGGNDHVRDTLISAAYLSDYSLAFGWGGLGHTWSLSIEEHFYLLWPLLLPLAACRPWILIILYVGVSAWRWSLPFEQAYYRFDAHCTGLILGALIAFYPVRVRETAGFGAALVVAFLMFVGRFGSQTSTGLIMTLAEMATAVLILSLLREGLVTRALSARLMLWLGSLSYGLYLWHVPIAVVIRPHAHWLVTTIATTAISLALAYLSARYVEIPVRRRGMMVSEKLRYRKSRSALMSST